MAIDCLHCPSAWIAALGLAAASTTAANATVWKAEEITKTYAVSGSTGIALYEAIGAKGPSSGNRRVIAHTTFSLKWSRNYRPQSDGSCKLESAHPFLTITYTLPEASGELADELRGRWDTFAGGIRRHERFHGDIIKDMVQQIIDTTVGFSVRNDRQCTKIRKAIEEPLKAASRTQQERSRAFDQEEMANGGAVHQLILGLINGP